MERRILHIDMDAFFASVEQVLNPSLRGKPVIVGGGDTRGVVSTASYEARVFGVHSAMPVAQARRLCPHGIFISGNYAKYREASQTVHTILETVSPLVEFASIDEAYVDVSGSQRLFGGDEAIARHIKTRIREATQLTCTIAVAPNKLVAKIASDLAKPDGFLSVASGDEAAFLRPLPIAKLRGAGPRTCELLKAAGVTTIGDLADLPERKLSQLFGPSGYGLQQSARGISTSPVEPESTAKSISRETTFEKDLTDWGVIEGVLAGLTERAAHALREDGMETKCVTLKVRYSDFSLQTFAKSLPDPTSVDREIFQVVRELIPKAQQRRAPIRLIGVGLTSLSSNQHQMGLFGSRTTEKWERLLESVDGIRTKHGFQSVHSAKTIRRDERGE